jgi:hypothetical protein
MDPLKSERTTVTIFGWKVTMIGKRFTAKKIIKMLREV